METILTTSTNSGTWEIVPTNTLAGIILAVITLYFVVRHFLFVMMLMDVVLTWLRKFRWFPGEGKRMRAFIHWIIALALFQGFLTIARGAGWLEFVPQ